MSGLEARSDAVVRLGRKLHFRNIIKRGRAVGARLRGRVFDFMELVTTSDDQIQVWPILLSDTIISTRANFEILIRKTFK